MAAKIVIFAGAPDYSSLRWDREDLLDHFLPPLALFTRPFDPAEAPGEDADASHSSEDDRAVWRLLPMRPGHLATGFSQDHHVFDNVPFGEPGFVNTLNSTSLASTDPSSTPGTMDPATLRQFYDHSLKIHEDIRSSQISSQALSSLQETSFESTGLSHSFASSSRDASAFLDRPAGPLFTEHLSDLEDIPAASYLDSIAPQTVTVNLIVGIISIAEPRLVRTRWGKPMALVELLVGDDTKSGFSVTFWLPADADAGTGPAALARGAGRRPRPGPGPPGPAAEEDAVRALRRQDVVLLRNVGLGSFRGRVHGHSLRKGFTKVDVLFRRQLDPDDRPGVYSLRDLRSGKARHPQAEKTKRVWEWTVDFVGAGPQPGPTGKRKRCARGAQAVRSWELPPADSP